MGLEACFGMDNEKGRQVYAPLPALLGCVVVDCVILCFFDFLLLFCYQVFCVTLYKDLGSIFSCFLVCYLFVLAVARWVVRMLSLLWFGYSWFLL